MGPCVCSWGRQLCIKTVQSNALEPSWPSKGLGFRFMVGTQFRLKCHALLRSLSGRDGPVHEHSPKRRSFKTSSRKPSSSTCGILKEPRKEPYRSPTRCPSQTLKKTAQLSNLPPRGPSSQHRRQQRGFDDPRGNCC